LIGKNLMHETFGAGADAVDALFAGLFGDERQAELCCALPRPEAPDRVGLPAGCLHDGPAERLGNAKGRLTSLVRLSYLGGRFATAII
jgi:hypothetical protein